MLIEQTHFPPSGTNWNQIIIGVIVFTSVIAIIYTVSKPTRTTDFTNRPKSKNDDVV